MNWLRTAELHVFPVEIKTILDRLDLLAGKVDKFDAAEVVAVGLVLPGDLPLHLDRLLFLVLIEVLVGQIHGDQNFLVVTDGGRNPDPQAGGRKVAGHAFHIVGALGELDPQGVLRSGGHGVSHAAPVRWTARR